MDRYHILAVFHLPLEWVLPVVVAGCLAAVLLPCQAAEPAAPSEAIESGEAGRLLAGAATSNITPPLGTSINGHLTDRTAVHIHDELHARALVLDNGRSRIAIVVCDSCMIDREVFDQAKVLATRYTNIPATHMLMSATHTHSAGACVSIFQSKSDPAYRAFLVSRIADAVRRAANNLAPAEIGFGVGSVPQHVFNRRWHMKPGAIPPDPFGGQTDQVKMNPPRASPDLLEPAGPTDPQVPVIAVRSSGGRPVATLANYAMHYVGGTGPNEISADYFGMFADRIQELLKADRLDPPFVGILSNGASGDINNINFRVPAVAQQPYEQMRLVANDVAAEAARVIASMAYQQKLALDVRTVTLSLGVRRPSAADLEAARVILEKAGGGPLVRLEQLYANETVRLAEYPERVEVPLQAIRLGDAAIVAIPCEAFVEIGLEIKAKSPFKPTILIELANGYNGYLPTARHHELGGYETWRARSSYLEIEAADRITSRLLALLDELKAE